jgi:hypothetical protein
LSPVAEAEAEAAAADDDGSSSSSSYDCSCVFAVSSSSVPPFILCWLPSFELEVDAVEVEVDGTIVVAAVPSADGLRLRCRIVFGAPVGVATAPTFGVGVDEVDDTEFDGVGVVNDEEVWILRSDIAATDLPLGRAGITSGEGGVMDSRADIAR